MRNFIIKYTLLDDTVVERKVSGKNYNVATAVMYDNIDQSTLSSITIYNDTDKKIECIINLNTKPKLF